MVAEDNRRGGDKGIRRETDRDEEDEGKQIKVLAKRKKKADCVYKGRPCLKTNN